MSLLRETGEVVIKIPALPRLTLAELKALDPFKSELVAQFEFIDRDTSPTRAVTMRLGTVFRDDEKDSGCGGLVMAYSITGAAYERRLPKTRNVLLGSSQARWVAAHRNAFPALQALLRMRPVFIINFPGVIVAGANKQRFMPCLLTFDKRLTLCWRSINTDAFGLRDRVAVSSAAFAKQREH